MANIKKYPIIHEGKEYEIRWEKSIYRGIDFDYINLYKVSKVGIFGLKIYTKVYSKEEWDSKSDLIIKNRIIDSKDPMYYVEQAKYVFNEYLRMQKVALEKEQIKQAQLLALSEWDGVIN